MKKLVSLFVVLSFGVASCYNTHYVTMDELGKIQNEDSGTATSLVTAEGETVGVEPGSLLFVRDVNGKRYPITPYNFKLINQQLVASDRDYIFPLNQLKVSAELDQLNKVNTGLLIGTGIAAVTALIVVTILTAGRGGFEGK